MIIPFEKSSRSIGGAGPQTGVTRRPARRWWSRPLIALWIALILHGQVGFNGPAQAQVSGNSYVSPQFGYTVTWGDSWFVVAEESSFYDDLMLTNGLSYCNFVGGPDPATTPEGGLAGFIAGVRTFPGISDFAPLVDRNGDVVRHSGEQHAYAAFTYTYTDETGSYELARYVNVQLLVPGETLVGFTCEMLASDFESERPQIEELLSGLILNPDDPAPPVVIAGPSPEFVSGPWRVAIATTAVSPTVPELKLKRKTDKEWMIVILDVTNWSDQDAELSARDFTIRDANGQVIAKIARSSMAKVAGQLGVEPFSDKLTMPITAGSSARVALAFVIPEGNSSPSLAHDGATLPLSTTIELELPADLSTAPAPLPESQAGEIVSASDGQTMSVLLDGRARAIRIQLLGVEPPAEGECGEHAAERAIDDLAGAKILVEEDAAVTGGGDPLRYVWLVNDDGTHTLLNHSLIADGMVMASPIPSDARFGLWLAETGLAAEQAETGLWAGCPESGSSPADAERSDTPISTPMDR